MLNRFAEFILGIVFLVAAVAVAVATVVLLFRFCILFCAWATLEILFSLVLLIVDLIPVSLKNNLLLYVLVLLCFS